MPKNDQKNSKQPNSNGEQRELLPEAKIQKRGPIRTDILPNQPPTRSIVFWFLGFLMSSYLAFNIDIKFSGNISSNLKHLPAAAALLQKNSATGPARAPLDRLSVLR